VLPVEDLSRVLVRGQRPYKGNMPVKGTMM
jgi:hypothetical protein